MEEENEENVRLKERLQELWSEEDRYSNTLAKEVIEEALEQDDVKSWFTGLLTHGCVSGWVGKLVYYTDTRNFYDEHYHEIEYLRVDFEESIGEPLKIDCYDLKNWFAWFAFEQTAGNIYSKLGFEY